MYIDFNLKFASTNEAGHEKRYQVLVSSYGDNRQNVKVIGKTEIRLWNLFIYFYLFSKFIRHAIGLQSVF